MEISKAWRHGAVLVLIVGFTVLMFMGRNTYKNAPPIPVNVVDPSGKVLFRARMFWRVKACFRNMDSWIMVRFSGMEPIEARILRTITYTVRRGSSGT